MIRIFASVSLACVLLLAALPGAAEAGDSAPPVDVSSLGLSATYEVSATFGWNDRHVSVDTTAVVTGSRPWTTSRLAFNLSTLRTGRARLTEVSVDGQPVEADVVDQTVVVPLPTLLEPGGQKVVRMVYSGRVNGSPRANSDEWGFARTGELLTAYRWIPWLSRTTRFDRPSVGDPFVTASSPRVRVALTIDRDLVLATSGELQAESGTTRTFEARDVRDFNLSASPSYRSATRRVRGATITFFHDRLPADAVLDVAARAFADFSDKVGAYPYRYLNIAEIGPWAPLESPSLFWLPDNAPRWLLPWMTAHETAHQWFYSVVGNDQAREPFADEAISDLMARNLISRFVRSQCPTGRLDQTIYEIGECYPWVIYVQGVAYLRDYRDRVGSRAFWHGVADYYSAHRFGIGGTRRLLAALDSAAGRSWRHDNRFPRLRQPVFACLPTLTR
jgi:hypothetical protein